MTFFFKHTRSLMAGLAVGVLSSAATPGLCGSINYSTLDTGTMSEPEKTEYQTLQQNLIASPYVKMVNVREEWDAALNGGVDSPLLSPPAPTASGFTSGATGGGVLVSFQPSNYSEVKTDSEDEFDLASKSTQVRLAVFGVGSSNVPGILGTALDDISITIGGELSVWAPLSTPLQPYDSFAQANVSVSGSLVLEELNWDTVPQVTTSFNMPLTLRNEATLAESVSNTISVDASGPGSKIPYTWYSNLLLDQATLRTSFGITDPEAIITKVSLTISSNISVVGVYGEGYAKVNNLSVSADGVEVQAVPEPPTIILAGLGAVAVVANGYRRRKQRSQGGNEAGNEGQDAGDLNGAIALTA